MGHGADTTRSTTNGSRVGVRNTLRDLEESSSSEEENEVRGKGLHTNRADNKGDGSGAKRVYHSTTGREDVYRQSSPPPLPAESVSMLSDGKDYIPGVSADVDFTQHNDPLLHRRHTATTATNTARHSSKSVGRDHLETDSLTNSIMTSVSGLEAETGGEGDMQASTFSHQSDLYDFVGLSSGSQVSHPPHSSQTHNSSDDIESRRGRDREIKQSKSSSSRGREQPVSLLVS